jgi:hypothetical protein
MIDSFDFGVTYLVLQAGRQRWASALSFGLLSNGIAFRRLQGIISQIEHIDIIHSLGSDNSGAPSIGASHIPSKALGAVGGLDTF